MKKILSIIIMLTQFVTIQAQSNEPENNLGKSLSLMRQKFPALRYIGTDTKGDQYEDGYPQDGIAVFFYFKNGYVIEECMICESNDNFPLSWYKSMIKTFDRNYYSVGKNNGYGKEYTFSTFTVNIIYVSENGKNTAMIIYEKDNTNSITYNNTQSTTSTRTYSSPQTNNGKVEWYNILYTEDKNDVRGMQSVGHFSATSSPTLFGSKSYDQAFFSALKKIQKKAAKKGVKKLLITYKSDMEWDFLTVSVEATGYK